MTHLAAVAVYLGCGFAGFYGFSVDAKANILHSLCTKGHRNIWEPDCIEHPENRMVYYYILGGAVVVSVAVTLPFAFFVLFKSLANKIKAVRESAIVDSAARIAIVALVTTTCVAVPSFTKMMDVMCDGLINVIVMIIPAACCLKIQSASGSGINLQWIGDLIIFILGFVNAYIGLSSSVPALFAKDD